ncbi:MAG: phosphate ABC transporter, permease protein PstA [Omnitrophica bacterium RIFCSPLOWO2_12_FULL_44_17]|uniref:Phosphate transport system permease protein PstA n=1 Tax=Candidatus Danuiimicrobium aquiferis TaxID=1801832 RepID=A0A1G1L1V7_9BACT|nr:MAG: phosphate ABC transporter, permease protein PstA [Omnitrophica bacterium RIFCSPHIGHO2_02_FULL_45_28]OGW88885.1 MAG: phosphate ABC transporter, permease protein PstA [Omnitrophica bacterium RIFCSPHIGHO2_12_FULL_44_12]OGW99114.1 MAG: phosphate ABC transporter, permease protein PstA [Omnitrophica bacterium RIFCSPLOWO2_12_FULL_44_17]OGX02609.1 MAG: phosphate ABC transporter, permease protein PstA [Omnitrophica bacterium RIFCSPLOWO2_02_FULL_44_11]
MRISSKTAQKIAFSFLGLAAVIVIVPVIVIFAILIQKGLPAINWQFLTAMPRMGMRAGGIFPAIMGTIYLVLGTIVVALPIGVLAAIYLVEYARRNWWTRMIEVAIVNLAGVPSVVYGLFGMGLFVIFLKFGASILSGSLTLSIMILPVIITASKEALSSVPRSFREASLALGVSKWQTIRYVVLPNALPGILTGTILGISRAAGETAPILFTVAAFYLPRLPKSIFDQCMALPYHLYVLSTQVPNVSQKVQYGTALVLVGLVFILNFFAVVIRSYMRSKKQW